MSVYDVNTWNSGVWTQIIANLKNWVEFEIESIYQLIIDFKVVVKAGVFGVFSLLLSDNNSVNDTQSLTEK